MIIGGLNLIISIFVNKQEIYNYAHTGILLIIMGIVLAIWMNISDESKKCCTPKYTTTPPPPPDISKVNEYLYDVCVKDYVAKGVKATAVIVPFDQDFVIVDGVRVPYGYEIVLREKEEDK